MDEPMAAKRVEYLETQTAAHSAAMTVERKVSMKVE
jgi:hypothetical protein